MVIALVIICLLYTWMVLSTGDEATHVDISYWRFPIFYSCTWVLLSVSQVLQTWDINTPIANSTGELNFDGVTA